MTLTRLAALALPAALLAAACSPARPADGAAPAKAEPAAAAAVATPAKTITPAEGAVWSFWQTEEGSHLTFAVPESDDTVNYFVCQTGTGSLQASMWADHPIPGDPGPEARTEMTQLTVSSGSVSKAYEAVAESEEMYGGSQVTAMQLGLDDPVIQAFARTGAVQFSAFGERTSMPAAPLAEVRKLLDACRKAD